ncbi:MATE family efflux transporter [Faecalibaculum rodentium]|uniref:Probable multidrug resistance protein NorM n=3 Tax=Faecalibaculum rodentium TaxID=1702221 RepID=A0A140DS81_9FIRM|nr:MATE family efflux transporter [Faecalibaculum rodentium]AMK53508.1 putative efflux protein MATE family [Faecalibaculum rodentium]
MNENKMGVQPVNRLLVSMSVPMMVSMLVQALYNVVDSIFVASLSEDALTAVSLAFPWQNLMIAVGVGTGVGVNAWLSRCLGEKDQRSANSTAENGIFLAMTSYLVFAVTGMLISRPFFTLQTSSAVIAEEGFQYMWIVSVFGIGLFLQTMNEKILASTGRTNLTMVSQLAGAAINIVLDPIMIFGLFGFPALGVAGAAIATVTGQIIGGLLGVWFNSRLNREIQIRFRGFRPDRGIIGHIYSVGLPSIILQSIGSIMTFSMNQILISFSTTAAAVLGVYFKLQSFVFMPIFGLNNGMVPIVAYNYGAAKPVRIMKTLKLAIAYALSIMGVGLLLFQLLPGTFLDLFQASDNMKSIGIPALRIISLCFVPAGFGIICGSFFQAMGHGMIAMWVSIVRQLGALIPLAWLLSRTGQLNLVWLAFPLAEIVAVVITTFGLRRVIRTQIRPLYGKQPQDPGTA